MNGKGILEDFLGKLKRLKPGQTMVNNNLYFTVFCFDQVLDFPMEIKNGVLYTPLNILLWARDGTQSCYDFFSNKKRYTIVSKNPGWTISGGQVTSDNFTGGYFLRAPTLNFGSNIEARLYTSRNEGIFSLKSHIKTFK